MSPFVHARTCGRNVKILLEFWILNSQWFSLHNSYMHDKVYLSTSTTTSTTSNDAGFGWDGFPKVLEFVCFHKYFTISKHNVHQMYFKCKILRLRFFISLEFVKSLNQPSLYIINNSVLIHSINTTKWCFSIIHIHKKWFYKEQFPTVAGSWKASESVWTNCSEQCP